MLTAVIATAFLLPETIYAAPGLECNIYYQSAIDSVVPWTYAYVTHGPVGRSETKRWCWTPRAEDAGTRHRLELAAWNDTGCVAATTVTVEVAAAPVAPERKRTMALFAASLTNSRYQDFVLADMREAGYSGFEMVGKRKGPMVGGLEPAAHDGYGGFSFRSFLTRYRFSDEEIAGLQSEAEREQLKALGLEEKIVHDYQRHLLRSPLLKFENGQVKRDIKGWMGTVNGGRPVDYVVFELGVNDVFSRMTSDRAANRKLVEEIPVANAKLLLAALREYMPDAHYVFCTEPPGCGQDGDAANYGAQFDSVRWRLMWAELTEAFSALVKELDDPKVSLLALAPAADPDNGYPKKEGPAASRIPAKVVRHVNSIHETREGAAQLGDAIAAFLRCRFAQEKAN